MKISVIVPAYITNANINNQLSTLVLKLSDQMDSNNHEVIVIDDGSPYPYKFKTLRSGIKFLSQENKGAAGARNAGLDAAKGDYVAFVDADDNIAEDFFSQLDKAAEKDADICYFKCTCENGSVAYHEPCAWGKLVKRSYIGERRFDEEQLIGEEDTLFLPLQAEKPPRIEYIDSTLYHYRWSANPDSLMKRYWRGELKHRKGEM